MATAWDKLEQLLTCAICLDRFRNPKMLPCQHSFCQEPCMEGLQDYARRQIKCPECRAEHRIPFQGIQTYPTNVTLQRFLELHQSITGEEPEPVPSMMERCGVCSEKSTVTKCSHCDKKVCPECKEAHIDILKREISRICHQVRRALNRLQDALSQTERSMERLNVNSVHIRDEIEEIVRRFVKDLKAQEDKMLKDLETYSQVESKNLAKLKDDLAIEYDFLKDNCDSVEKNIVDPEKNWNDAELCEVKYIFVKTLDFLRNFDADAADYTRGMKFLPSSELDTLRRSLVNFGELKLLTSEEANANVRASSPGLTGGSNSLSVPQQSMLMRSQSDHRLATQFARRDSRISDLTSQSRLNPGYSDSEKDPRDSNRATSPSNYSRSRRDDASRLGRYGASDDARDSTSRNRFLRESDNYRSGWARTDDDSFTSGPQFKSRFMRERGAELSGFDEFDYDPNAYLSRSVRFEEPTTVPSSVPTPLVKVFDVPEAPRGCLSGIVKISDTAHYMERSHENEVRAKVEKERKEEESRSLPPPSSIPAYQSPQRPRPPSRQVSEDEIEKQKKMNQASAASSVTTNTNSSLTNNTTSTFNSSTTTPSTIGLTSTTAPVNSYGSSITASNTQSSDSIRPITRRIGTFRDDEDSRSSSTHRSTSDSNSSSTRRSDTNDLTSSLVDDADDDLGESNLSRLGRRRRGSLTGEDSKESVTSSGRSSQVSATPASSASTATSGLRSVRAPLAKNLPIAEEEEDRDRDIARKRGPKSSLVNPTASSLGSSIGKQTDNRNKDDDFTQPKSKFGYSHGGWAVEEWEDDQDEEEEEEEEEVDEDEEDGEEEAEEEEELIEEDEQEEEENDEDEEDAEDAEEEEEEDNGNGNISRQVARPSTPEPLVLVPRRNYGLNIGSNVTSSGLRYHLNRSEIRMHKMLREQEQQNVTPTQPEQYDKSRENGLPCSVADLLDRSAQVRRDSVELRHRFFEVDRPSSSHEHKPGNTRASSSSQMGGLSDQQSHHQSEMPGSSKSFLEETPTSRKPIYRPSRYPLGRSEGGLDSSTRTGKLNRSSANTVNDKHETPSWSRSKPNRLSSHARSNINPITSTSGFDNHNLSTTTVKPKPLKKSSDRSYYHSPNYHSNPVTGRIISPALTSVNSGPLAASSASASTAASNALSSSSHNYDLSNSRLSRSKSSHLLGGW